jgi:hypothetical protein
VPEVEKPMKFVLLLLVVFSASLAAASEVPNPLLKKMYTSGGSMAPEWRKHETCTVLYNGMIQKQVQMAGNPPEVSKPEKPKFTGEVKNVAAIHRLTQQAKKAKLQPPHGVGPIGGGVTIYQAIETIGVGEPKQILLRQTSNVVIERDSKAVDALVDFLDKNCD